MGFNKRYINMTHIIQWYNKEGVREVKNNIDEADAIMCIDKESRVIVDMCSSDISDQDIINKIQEYVYKRT
tara:strand:+ start:198 stop:410 length:213 start_codon:yes stop_codon:yes gene_type:complete